MLILLADANVPDFSIGYIIAIVAAFLGPWSGVIVAYIFSRRQSKRVAAAELFRKIIDDAQNYHFAMRLGRLGETMDDVHDTKLIDKIGHVPYQKLQLEKLANRTEKYQIARSALRADQLSLRILFDKTADSCILEISKLLKFEITNQPLPQQLVDSEMQQMYSVIDAIEAEIIKLSKTLIDFDEMDINSFGGG
jgi:hypothetical protein